MKDHGMTAHRRGICVLCGMAIGFRLFFTVVVSGNKLLNSGWISILLGCILALPAALLLMLMRRKNRTLPAETVVKKGVGIWGSRLFGIVLFAVMSYETAATAQIFCDTARHVALSGISPLALVAVTLIAAMLAVSNGTDAVAGAGILWSKLATILLLLLLVIQVPYYRPAFLTPILGPGLQSLAEGALPIAGIFSFVVAAWMMLRPERDNQGTAMLRTVLITCVVSVIATIVCAMLLPTIVYKSNALMYCPEHLLITDRAGLSLEMIYVILFYGGLMTTVLFELCAAARALKMVFPMARDTLCTIFSGIVPFIFSALRLTDTDMVEKVSMWYYPLIVIPVVIISLASIKGGSPSKEERT